MSILWFLLLFPLHRTEPLTVPVTPPKEMSIEHPVIDAITTTPPVLALPHRHLARNPFICDCNLRWLAEYLHRNPIETSGARCDAPKRMHRRRIEALRDDKFKCKYSSRRRSEWVTQQGIEIKLEWVQRSLFNDTDLSQCKL